ncbi:MAG: MoaD/ThiS family protein [Spirochaetia bacterium]|nr:MoaD/ThiS family protein [Spirochaetia bacterium]
MSSGIGEVDGGAVEITVRLRYLSAVRERTGTREDELHLPAGSTLAAVGAWLKLTYGIAVPDPSLMSTLNGYGWNQVPQGLATELRDGDEVALFPLLSGG